MKKLISTILFLSFSLATKCVFASESCVNNTDFNVGVGIYDITGPAAEEGMMGYAMPWQHTTGLLQRLWARAFVIESPCNGKRIAFVNTDLGMVFQAIKQQVIQKLQQKYGYIYSDQNVLLTATHTHSGPGGFSTYAFYNLTTLGFNRDNFNTISNGIVAAIERAQNHLQLVHIKIASGELNGISHNRSPESFQLDPQSDRDRFPNGYDPTMTLIRFDNTSGKPIGLFNWFALHGVSMNNKNGLINGDNKGYAEYLFEKDFNSHYDENAFVAAFGQANSGDVSPNEYGHEGGTGEAGRISIEHAGRPQYEKAKILFNNANELLIGDVDYRHEFVEMDHVNIDPQYTDGKPRTTCPSAIGISMIAGTQDGEGFGKQGISCNDSDPLGKLLCHITSTSCQGVKPIAIQMGTMKPYPWTPNRLPLQLVKIGNLIVIASPFELTTIAGARIRDAVAKSFPVNQYHIVISAPSNAYEQYVTTPEEYQLQRYEGASNHYGPWTLAALQQEFSRLANALKNNTAIPAGPEPLDLSKNQITIQTNVIFDDIPIGKKFGDVYQDVNKTYHPNDIVQAVFWTGHPKNDFRIQDSFLAVQQLINNHWQTIRLDRDWDTDYAWQRKGVAYSLATITWHIPSDITPGQYRLVHYGNWKSVTGKISPLTGYSSVFTVD